MLPFTVKVDYQLREYLSVVWDFAQYAGKAGRRSDMVHPLAKQETRVGLLTKISLAIVATPIFFYKISRVGRCEFTFTESGLTRMSKGSSLQTPWDEIRYVYPLSQVFLFAKAVGAMPVPYRCLSRAQHELLEDFVSRLNCARQTC